MHEKKRINPYDLQSYPNRQQFKADDHAFIFDAIEALLGFRLLCPKQTFNSIHADSLKVLPNSAARSYIKDAFLGTLDTLSPVVDHLSDQTAAVLAALIVIRVHTEEAASIFDVQDLKSVLAMSRLNIPGQLVDLYSGLITAAAHFRNQNLEKGPDQTTIRLRREAEKVVLRKSRREEGLTKALSIFVLANGEKRLIPYRDKARSPSIFSPSARAVDSILHAHQKGEKITVNQVIAEAEEQVGTPSYLKTFSSLDTTIEHFSSIIASLDGKSLPYITNTREFKAIFGIHPSALKQRIRSRRWGISISELIHAASEHHANHKIVTVNDYRECQTPNDLIQLMAHLLTTRLVKTPTLKFYRTTNFREVFGVSPTFIIRLANGRGWEISLSQVISDIECSIGSVPERPPQFSTKEAALKILSQAILTNPSYSRPSVKNPIDFKTAFGINPRTLQSRIRKGGWGTTVSKLVRQAEIRAGY